MRVYEREFEIAVPSVAHGLLAYLARATGERIGVEEHPIRFAVSATARGRWRCEVGLLVGPPASVRAALPSIFDFARRPGEDAGAFNVAMLVPTGIGCELGGHAGDAGAVARLLATVCDRLILHPNVVNGSDLNEMPENALYVEGSVLCRLLQGTIGLQPVRSNRVLVVMDGDRERYISDAVINSVNAACAVYGLRCPRIVALDRPPRLYSEYTASGRAAGRVEGLEHVLAILEREAGHFDALALSGVIHLPLQVYLAYLRSDGEMVNPLGGIEAIYTHALSLLTELPCAHAPMYAAPDDTADVAELHPTNPGVVDPRMAAEVISNAFFQCVLKGLQRSPKIVADPAARALPGVLNAPAVSCLVIPEGVLGLPVLAALEQGIPVIAVRENRNRMSNDLTTLPWAAEQYLVVENYLEAVGALAALRSGLSLQSLRRPLRRVPVTGAAGGAQEVLPRVANG